MLDKSTILAALDLKKQTVPVSEWGGDVIVQEMTALDRDRLVSETRAGETTDTVNYAAKVLVRCLANEDGSRMFDDNEAETLGRKSPTVIAKLFAVASKLNGTDTTIENQSKNSEPGLTESSSSASA